MKWRCSGCEHLGSRSLPLQHSPLQLGASATSLRARDGLPSRLHSFHRISGLRGSGAPEPPLKRKGRGRKAAGASPHLVPARDPAWEHLGPWRASRRARGAWPSWLLGLREAGKSTPWTSATTLALVRRRARSLVAPTVAPPGSHCGRAPVNARASASYQHVELQYDCPRPSRTHTDVCTAVRSLWSDDVSCGAACGTIRAHRCSACSPAPRAPLLRFRCCNGKYWQLSRAGSAPASCRAP